MAMRRLQYLNPFAGSGRYCPNVLLSCVDPRFHRFLEEALGQLFIPLGGLHEFASIAIPGAARAAVDERLRPVLFEALDIVISRHDANRLIIANHVDCGAYGGSEAFGGPEQERAFHLDQLQEAASVVRRQYPRLEVVRLYQDWSDITQVD